MSIPKSFIRMGQFQNVHFEVCAYLFKIKEGDQF